MPSESVSRASRRELRRAMGDGAVTVIEQQAVVLAKHAALLQALITSNELHELQLKVLRAEVSSLREAHGRTFTNLAEFYGRSFRLRLRWLFTGR